MMNKWNVFHFLWASNFFYCVVIIVVIQVVKMLISCQKHLVTHLSFNINPQSFDSITHRVTCLHTRQIFQKLRINSHIRWFFMQLIIIRWVVLWLFQFAWVCIFSSVSIWIVLWCKVSVWSCFSCTRLLSLINTRKLLLGFRAASFINHLLTMLLISHTKTRLLWILDSNFRCTTLNLIVFKAYSFVRDIVALFFVFFIFWIGDFI